MITVLTKEKRYNAIIEEVEKFKTKIIVYDNEKEKEVINANTVRDVKQATSYLYKIYDKSEIKIEINFKDKSKIVVKTTNQQIDLFKPLKSEYQIFIEQITNLVDRYKVNKLFDIKFRKNEEGNLVCDFWTKVENGETFSYIIKRRNIYYYYNNNNLIKNNTNLETIFE